MFRVATVMMIASLTASPWIASAPAWAGANPDVHLALDMMVRAKSQSCETLAGRYLSCDSIRVTLPDTGSFRAAIVVYNVESVTGVQYALSWPEDWEIEDFTPCGSLTIGGETDENPMEVSTVWSTPQTATGSQGVMVGLLTGHAGSPGCITITTPGQPGGLMVADGTYEEDSIAVALDGCVASEPFGDPCDLGEIQAGFEASVTQGTAPLEVVFTDRSRGWRHELAVGLRRWDNEHRTQPAAHIRPVRHLHRSPDRGERRRNGQLNADGLYPSQRGGHCGLLAPAGKRLRAFEREVCRSVHGIC